MHLFGSRTTAVQGPPSSDLAKVFIKNENKEKCKRENKVIEVPKIPAEGKKTYTRRQGGRIRQRNFINILNTSSLYC